MPHRPIARTESIVTEWVNDELVLFDQTRQVAHCLSPGAAAVWECSDGARSQEEIGRVTGLSPAEVARAVEALREGDLLDEGPVAAEPGYSRREATIKLARAGGAAFAAPLIYSVTVGSAAGAVNCGFPPCGCHRQCTPAQVPTGTLPVDATISACGGITISATATSGTCSNVGTPASAAGGATCGQRANSSCCYGLCYPQFAVCGGPTGNSTGTCAAFRCATQYGCWQHVFPCPNRANTSCGTFSTSGDWCRGNGGKLCCPPGVCCASPHDSINPSPGFNYGCCSGWCTGSVCGTLPATAGTVAMTAACFTV
jgi:hypothetical protein